MLSLFLDFSSILLTSATAEYNNNEEIFQSAISHEWAKSYRDHIHVNYVNEKNRKTRGLESSDLTTSIESETYGKLPFIVCSHVKEVDGFTRRKEVSSHFGDKLAILYNHEDKSCFITRATHGIATSAKEAFSVIPYTPVMKISRDGVFDILGNVTKSASQIRMDLCSGVSGEEMQVSC